uniref:SCP domain-containing protein n=1 Tax=Sphenodon punctatus TaxID=8508 RepID=A0A8D0HQH5_SPHPU
AAPQTLPLPVGAILAQSRHHLSLSQTYSNQQKEIVAKHNALRRGVTPTASNMVKMEWDSATAESAKRWANKCTLSHSPSAERNGISCGENLYMSSQPDSWSAAIQDWYDEVKDFKYGVGATKAGAMIGHYTQIVWFKSFQVGCAAAYCPLAIKEYYYVCQYCPAGNLPSKISTPYNAGQSCGDCPQACDNGLCSKYEELQVITCMLCPALCCVIAPHLLMR